MDFSSKVARAAGFLLRIALAVIFIYAAWAKIKDPWQMFAMSIDSYKLLPLWVVEWTARVLPWVELAVGIMLLAGVWLRVGTAAASAMLLVFFVLMVRAYAKGMEISCGCFGPGDIISWRTLVRDGSMLAGALFITWMSFRRRNHA
jgi:uncharacterized membrane protein YphA (DoxX/SURF4 family)